MKAPRTHVHLRLLLICYSAMILNNLAISSIRKKHTLVHFNLYTQFTGGSICEIDICDNNTTEVCKEQENSGTVRCTCKEGYIRSQFTSLLCIRKYLFCSIVCMHNFKQFKLVFINFLLCSYLFIACPNGEMAVDEDNCEKYALALFH